MEYIEKTERETDAITSAEQKDHVITKYLLDKELVFKIDPFDRKAVIKKVLEEGEKIIIQVSKEEDLPKENSFILYTILAKYIQLECILLQKLENSLFIIKVEKLAIARKNRETQRFQVESDTMYVTNVVSSKTVIEANMFNIPTLVKVNFEDFKNRLKQKTNDTVNIDTFGPGLNHKFEIVKKTLKYLLLENTQDPNSYKNNSPGRIHYEKEIDDDLDSCIQEYKDQQIISELIVPIVYINHPEEQIPIGYFSIQSKEQSFTEKDIQEFQALANDMIERIKESNTIKTSEHFSILEISKGGIRVKIENPHLIETLPKQNDFVFDIFFKMQAPFTVHGIIRWLTLDENGHLILGIELAGKSDLPGERARFESNIELLASN
ncbi:DUF1577 domain-containing protein [Leptospira interrogans]|uniref:DUF1577 domain-containing protein n=1 Tax=Leptospira interrogans TaxID=173 RepID=UPI00122C3FE9|nr:DUF1577 domain-containing protein [Leptospira interrogans]KAA1268210.1 hypothetical protein C5473_09570 [Leptospira interrogans serovar Weerasinghe]ULG81852.1 DUF1577 domain-containing protein [Leptospira interrogans]UML69474.1 DUF1577 domain-containing protein [Leptospira interrogans]UML72799.1 DUF1577 domain-containing protein [Leptospira interrogans]